MDLPGGLGGLGALLDGPGPDLLGSGGEEGHEAQQVIAGGDELVKAAFLDAQLGEVLRLLRGLQLRDLLLDAGADGETAGAFSLGHSVEGLDEGVVVVPDIVLGDVRHVDDGLVGQQEAAANDLLLLLVRLEGAGGLAALQMIIEALQ